MARGVDGFGVALELNAAEGRGAGPDIFVVDGVRMFGGDRNGTVLEGGRHFAGPEST